MAGGETKKAFALRLSAEVFDAMQRWADDDLRSLNAQIEWALRESLRKQGRLKPPPGKAAKASAPNPSAARPQNPAAFSQSVIRPPSPVSRSSTRQPFAVLAIE